MDVLASRVSRRKAVLAVVGVAVAAPAAAQLKSGDNPDASPNWLKVRASLFQARPIETATAELLTLDAPSRAVDAAVVPIAVRTRPDAPRPSVIRKLWLVIDNNPSPIAAIVQYAPAAGRIDLETRVRVDEYSHVRAIGETADGRLVMATRFVKASGGCSAPPGLDPAAALATMGRMNFQLVGPVVQGQPVLAQLTIQHPNHSGMAMDQLTRHYTPAHFVRSIDITYDGEPVLNADVDFAISENPSLRFYFVPGREGELRALVSDTRERRYEGSLRVSLAS